MRLPYGNNTVTLPFSDDHQPVAATIAAYAAPLQAFVRSRVGSPEDAADIVQEVWYQYSRTGPDGIAQPRAWLFRVARNKVIDHYRRLSPDYLEDFLVYESAEEGYRNDLVATEDTPELSLIRTQFWELLYDALEALPEAQRTVFVRNELEGYTMREIAARTDEPLKTIISRKGYAVRRLRAILEPVYAEFWED
jgi:RNA polymerase sigma factor (sigma-70 family)